MILENELQRVGLSDKEAKVYIAALELGLESVQNIAEKAGVNRATTYSVLEGLITKGLIGISQEGKKTRYSVHYRDYLNPQFEIRKKEIEESQKNFKKILPQLSSIHNVKKNKPVIKYYEGKSGLLSCAEDFTQIFDPNSNEPARMIYNRDKIINVITDEERSSYAKMRTDRKVKSKVLYNTSVENILRGRMGSRLIVDEKDFKFDGDISIYKDYIRMSSLGKPINAILIQDKCLAQTLKAIFDMAWETALRNKIEEKKSKK